MKDDIIMNNVTTNFKCEELNTATKLVAEKLTESATNTLHIAGIMARVKKGKLYEDDFKSFGEYAEKTFGFKKSKASQLAKIGEKFVSINDDFSYKGLTVNGNFTYAQLLELRDEDADSVNLMIEKSEISEDTSAKKIRELENSKKENDDEPSINNSRDILIKGINRLLKKYQETNGKDELYLDIANVINTYEK